MAEPNENKKQAKKKTKSQTSVKLPNARRSLVRQRHMSQGKANYNGWWGLLGGIVVALLIAFVLLGGINQRKFLNTMGRWATNIGEKINGFVHPENIQATEDGIYYIPGSGENSSSSSTSSSSSSSNVEIEENVGDVIFGG